jgi:hypothetical protein
MDTLAPLDYLGNMAELGLQANISYPGSFFASYEKLEKVTAAT